MEIKQYPQKSIPVIALSVLLLAILACGTSSNQTSPILDPDGLQTAIVSTALAAELQTQAAISSNMPIISTDTSEQISATLPISTIEPTSTLDPRAALKAEVERVLGTSNRNILRLTAFNFDDPEQGAIFINWAINDNLTENLIKFGAKSDATDILKALAQSGIDYTYVILSGSFPMVDEFGNSDEKNVVNLTFYEESVGRINWDNFLSDNIYNIADEAFVWTAFQDK